jgi:hypothetical protein
VVGSGDCGPQFISQDGSECAGGRPHQATIYKSDEIRRSWKRCLCPVYASGTIEGRFKRRNTERADWAEAKAVVRAWEDAASWDGVAQVPASPAPGPQAPEAGRITIERAIRLLLANLKAFSANRGVVMIDQWGPIDVREFRSSWPVSPRTAVKKIRQAALRQVLYCLPPCLLPSTV